MPSCIHDPSCPPCHTCDGLPHQWTWQMRSKVTSPPRSRTNCFTFRQHDNLICRNNDIIIIQRRRSWKACPHTCDGLLHLTLFGFTNSAARPPPLHPPAPRSPTARVAHNILYATAEFLLRLCTLNLKPRDGSPDTESMGSFFLRPLWHRVDGSPDTVTADRAQAQNWLRRSDKDELELTLEHESPTWIVS